LIRPIYKLNYSTKFKDICILCLSRNAYRPRLHSIGTFRSFIIRVLNIAHEHIEGNVITELYHVLLRLRAPFMSIGLVPVC